jgi:hypothetical protein
MGVEGLAGRRDFCNIAHGQDKRNCNNSDGAYEGSIAQIVAAVPPAVRTCRDVCYCYRILYTHRWYWLQPRIGDPE